VAVGRWRLKFLVNSFWFLEKIKSVGNRVEMAKQIK